MAPQRDRPKALHVVATVLDFSHEERRKVGLGDSMGPEGGGWLNKLLYPGGPPDANSTQSLSEAFVRFLEKESVPQPPFQLSVPQPAFQPLSDRQPPADNSRSPTPSHGSSSSARRTHGWNNLLVDIQVPNFMQKHEG